MMRGVRVLGVIVWLGGLSGVVWEGSRGVVWGFRGHESNHHYSMYSPSGMMQSKGIRLGDKQTPHPHPSTCPLS